MKRFDKRGPHQSIEQNHENYAHTTEEENNLRKREYGEWAWLIPHGTMLTFVQFNIDT